jgi:hypothetical protein
MTRHNPFGNSAKIADDNDPVYLKMMNAAIERLKATMTAEEYTAWQQATFERGGQTMADFSAREVWLAASIAATFRK